MYRYSRNLYVIRKYKYWIAIAVLSFIDLVVDGYYMQVALRSNYMNEQFQEYLDNWNEIEKNLDEITAQCLLEAYSIE